VYGSDDHARTEVLGAMSWENKNTALIVVPPTRSKLHVVYDDIELFKQKLSNLMLYSNC